MAWKMIGEPKSRRLTRSLADEFSGMTPAPHDRPLNPTRASIIRAAFEKEKFRTCEWASAYCAETKQTYRINGKHTSTVLSSMNGEFPKNISVIVENYHCDTLEDVAALYCTFDTKASVRTAGDINRIYAATCHELNGVSPRYINVGITGISYNLWGDSYCQHSAEERAQLVVSNVEFVLWLHGLGDGIDQHKTRHIFRGPVVGVMFGCWKKSRQAATEFWTAVRDATGAKPDLPDRRLERFLTGVSMTNRGNMSASKRASSREIYYRCVTAWNAWRRGEKSELKYFANAKIPSIQ